MLRIRIKLPKQAPLQCYSHQDLLHDALINAWIKAGAEITDIAGHQAKYWNFAALGWHRGHQGLAHSLIVSTPDSSLARILSRFDPANITKRRWDEDSVNFSGASIQIEPDPVLPGQEQLGCLFFSPLLMQDKHYEGKGRRWHKDLKDPTLQLNQRINRQLSLRSGREVTLSILPDDLYLRANPEHSVLVNLKIFQGGKKKSFVIGMQAPFLLSGSEADLRLAWYSGLGEKTRDGFGCIGLLEQGVGR